MNTLKNVQWCDIEAVVENNLEITVDSDSSDLILFLRLGFCFCMGVHHLDFSSLGSVISCVARQSMTAEVSHIEPKWMDGTKKSRVKKKTTSQLPFCK